MIQNKLAISIAVSKSVLPCFSKEVIELPYLWLHWKIENPGDLGFVIEPYNTTDDIDFVLFEENNGKLYPVRCMAAGAILGTATISDKCLSATGLRNDGTGTNSPQGCSNQNNFLTPIQTQASKTYYLLVLNATSNNGFSINFHGDATFTPSTTPFLVTKIYPNPAKETTTVSIKSFTEKPVTLLIIDPTGKKLFSKEYPLSKGKNTIELDVSTLALGAYYLKIVAEDEVVSRRFLVQ